MRSLLLATAIMVLSSASAMASTTYDFIGTGGLQNSYSFTSDGITVTASPGTFSTSGGGTTTSVGQVNQSSGGLGLKSSSDDHIAIDGKNANDIISFEFSENVLIESVSFSYYTSKDEFSFFFDAGDDGSLNGDAVSYNWDADLLSDNKGFFSFASFYEGSLFGIGAEGNDDKFKITGMTVSAVSVVPLPAALPLYGAGLVVMGFVGWRRKQRIS